jgi:hypothetical protein
MTGDPRIYCLYELVTRADKLRADQIRREASPRGVRTVYLRDKRVIDVRRFPADFFRDDASEPHQSPVKYLAQYSLAYDLCSQYEEEDLEQRGTVVHFRANSPLNHVPPFIPGFTGPPTPQRSVEVSAAITKSVVSFSLVYTSESTPPPGEMRRDGRRDDEFPHSRIGFAGRTLPAHARPIFGAPSSADQIGVLESTIGGPLVPSLRSFFETHDSISAMDVHVGYWIGGIDTILRSLRSGDFPVTIESRSVFPIGSDGGGNAFLIPIDADGPVWKWSHETGEVCKIAESFERFMDRLADDFRMFAAGKDDWAFMAG